MESTVAIMGVALVAQLVAGGVSIDRAREADEAPSVVPLVGEVGLHGTPIRGAIAAVDPAAHTVTLTGLDGQALTLEVTDARKLEAVEAGDRVVVTYVAAELRFVRLADRAAPSASVGDAPVRSTPHRSREDTAGRDVTRMATIADIDRAKRTVTLTGPGNTGERLRIRDLRTLDGIAVGELVEITYTPALAITLDKLVR